MEALLTSMMLPSAVLGTTMNSRDLGGMLSGSVAISASGCLLTLPDRLRSSIALCEEEGMAGPLTQHLQGCWVCQGPNGLVSRQQDRRDEDEGPESAL